MPLASEIGAYLETQSIGEVGADIFLTRLPDTPDAVIAIIPYPGPAPEDTLQTPNAWTYPRFQVLVRNPDYVPAYAKSLSIFQLLNFGEATLSGVHYMRCRPLQSEPFIDRDANERTILRMNYEAWKEVS